MGVRMIKEFFLTLLIAMVPVIELRGAIPFAVGAGLPVWASITAAIIGNMIPIPFIIVFIRRIFAFIRLRNRHMDKFVAWCENKAAKNSKLVYRYELLGLMVFVAIPLPGTGAWTGALIAALMDIRLKSAVPVIFLGVVIAGVIMCILSYGVKMLFTL